MWISRELGTKPRDFAKLSLASVEDVFALIVISNPFPVSKLRQNRDGSEGCQGPCHLATSGTRRFARS